MCDASSHTRDRQRNPGESESPGESVAVVTLLACLNRWPGPVIECCGVGGEVHVCVPKTTASVGPVTRKARTSIVVCIFHLSYIRHVFHAVLRAWPSRACSQIWVLTVRFHLGIKSKQTSHFQAAICLNTLF